MDKMTRLQSANSITGYGFCRLRLLLSAIPNWLAGSPPLARVFLPNSLRSLRRQQTI
jgi:hypothetical protein